MTIEDTVPDTMPAEDALLPGVKPATTWRRRFLRFSTVLFCLWTMLTLAGETFTAHLEYQRQLKMVEDMEGSSPRLNLDHFDTDPRWVAFFADPVFSSPEWHDYLDLLREMKKDSYATARDNGIWWPGLAGRANAAIPAHKERMIKLYTGADGLAACNYKALSGDETASVDEQMAWWVERFEDLSEDDDFWQAELAVMPGIIRAADQHLCPAGAESGTRDE